VVEDAGLASHDDRPAPFCFLSFLFVLELFYMKIEKYILGIDGGGTKTGMVLANEDEKVLAQVKVGPTNMHTVPANKIIKYLQQGFKALLKEAKLPKNTKLSAIGAGFAGIDSPTDLNKAKRVLKKACGKCHPPAKNVRIVNDTIIGFWSGTRTQEGICIVGGTGSNCYGRTKRGKEAWSGGLDWILSDQGSGFEQGWKAFKEIVRAADGRGEKTILTKYIFKHYGIKKIRDLLPIVYGENYGKNDIGQLALLVEKAGIAGDKIGKRLCTESADELVSLIKAVANGLRYAKSHKFDLVMVGGVIQNNPIVRRRFKKEVKKLSSYAHLHLISYPQVSHIRDRFV